MREAYLTGNDTPAETATPQVWFFTSVALTDDFNLTLTGSRMGEVSDEFTITRYCKPHPDMLRALRRLTLHMCLLTEELTAERLYPGIFGLPTDALNARLQLRDGMQTGEAFVHPDLEKFRCTSVLWKPKGVVLKGVKKARYRFMGKELEVKTPTVEVRPGLCDDEDEEPADWEYPYFEQMDNSLRDLTGELVAFMGGKYGEGGQQLELFGKDAPAPTVLEAFDALDEALHASQLRRDAAGDEGTGLGTIHNPRKRKARRTADRKSGKDAAAGKDD